MRKTIKISYTIGLLLSLLLFCSAELFAQKNLLKANTFYNRNMYNEAIDYYLKEIEISEGDIKAEAMIKVANCYRLTSQFSEAEEWYKKIYRRRSKDPINISNYAQALKSSSKYAEAKEIFIKYKKIVPDDPMADVYIKSCELAEMWLIESVDFEVRNQQSINSIEPDISPSFVNNNIVAFCSSREGSTKKFISTGPGGNISLLDFFSFDIKNYEKGASNKDYFEELNTIFHEGPACFFKKGQEVYFTRTVKGKRSKENNEIKSTLQIFHSKKTSDGTWSEPISAFSFNSDEYSTAHPTISRDEKEVFFASNMPGGHGGMDIYFVKKTAEGNWTTPENIGSEVNTFGSELTPYISQDGTLYFSSDKHPGMGKKDIFKATFENNIWTNITNLKPPINTLANDYGFIIDSSSQKGFFCSDRFNGMGADDIYSAYRIKPVQIIMEGSRVKIPNETFFNGEKYKIQNTITEEKSIPRTTEDFYYFKLNNNQKYKLNVRKNGFSSNRIYIEDNRDSANFRQVINFKASRAPLHFEGFVYTEFAENIIEKDSSIASILHYPVSNAIVNLYSKGKLISTTKSDDEGAYNFNRTFNARKEYTITIEKGKELIAYSAGKIINNKNPVQNAKIELLEDGKIIRQKYSTNEGQYSFKLTPGHNYDISVSKEKHLDVTIPILASELIPSKTLLKNINLQRVDSLVINELVSDTSVYDPNDGMIAWIGRLKHKGVYIEGAKIRLFNDMNDMLEEVYTNEEGVYHFKLNPYSYYEISHRKKGFEDGEMGVTTKKPDKNNPIIRITELKIFDPNKVTSTIDEQIKSGEIKTEKEFYSILLEESANEKTSDYINGKYQIDDTISVIKDKNGFQYMIGTYETKEEGEEHLNELQLEYASLIMSNSKRIIIDQHIKEPEIVADTTTEVTDSAVAIIDTTIALMDTLAPVDTIDTLINTTIAIVDTTTTLIEDSIIIDNTQLSAIDTSTIDSTQLPINEISLNYTSKTKPRDIYTIKIAESKKELPTEIIQHKYNLSDSVSIIKKDNIYHYTTGSFSSKDSADIYLQKIDIEDAKIITTVDSTRPPISTDIETEVVDEKTVEDIVVEDVEKETTKVDEKTVEDIVVKDVVTEDVVEEITKENITYKIQVAETEAELPTKAIQEKLNIEDDIAIIEHEGKYKYAIKSFKTPEKALQYLGKLNIPNAEVIIVEGDKINNETKKEIIETTSEPNTEEHISKTEVSKTEVVKILTEKDSLTIDDVREMKQTSKLPSSTSKISQLHKKYLLNVLYIDNVLFDPAEHRKNLNKTKAAKIAIKKKYKIQLAAFGKEQNLASIKKKYNFSGNIEVEHHNGLYKYMIKNAFYTCESAQEYLKALELRDAYIIIYHNNKRSDERCELIISSKSVNSSIMNESDKIQNKKISYRIQIAASRNKLSASDFKKKYNLKDKVDIIHQNGLFIYTVKNFETYYDAKKYIEEINTKGVFVIGYLDGKKVYLNESILKKK